MKGTNRFKLLSIVLVFAYLLSACSGAQGTPGGGKPQSREVAFTGTVEAVGGGQITVSGQVVSLDAKSIVDPNIQVGDIVKVEAQVSESGLVIAVKVESFGADDANTNSTNANDANTNDGNSNTGIDDNSNSATNTNDDNSNDGGMTSGTEQEIKGVVTTISATSVTVGGVEYKFAASTEFKSPIFVGDTVKLHVMVGADGSLTIREIEKVAGTSIGNDNSNDDNSNDDNSNGNANDDHGNDNGGGGNSNDDNGNDDNSNSGSNSNGG